MPLSLTKRLSMNRAVASIAAAVLLTGSLAACTHSEPAGGEDAAALRVAVSSDVVSLDPQLQGDMTSMSVASNIFDTLTVRQADGELGPGLATEWEQTDPKTWTFTIREGVTFHNGEELTAETVAYSINRLIDPDTGSPIVELVNVDKAVADDATTVRFEMKNPDPVLPAKVSLFGGVVVPEKLIEEEGADAFAEHPVGTGPYRFVSRTQAQEIVLEANPDYWGEVPQVKDLTFKIMPDPSGSLAALQAGQVDIVTGLSADAAAQLESNSEATVHSTPGIRTYSVNMDTISDGPLADVKVRQALNHAVDVPTIIDTVEGGTAEQVATLIPTSVFGHDPAVEPYDHDPEKAKELLAEAGYEDGFSTTLSASNVDSALAQAVAGQLAEVGVKAKVRQLDAQTAKEEMITLNENHDGGLFLGANSGWTLDSVSFLQSYVKSDRRSSRWNNEEANELVIKGETETDPEVRKQVFSRMQELLKEEAPFIYMFTIANTYAASNAVSWEMPVTGALTMASAKVE